MTMKPNTPESGATDDAVTPANDPGPAPADVASEPDALAQLEAERTELKERLLRTLADMENLRRRTEREVAEARTYAVSNFARDMLTVADNFQRAIDSVPAEARAAGDPALSALIEGIELTERDLLKTLERHGVKRLDPEGQRFDPHLHQAMFEVPEPGGPGRDRGPGGAVGLRDRRPRAAPGPGRRRQGRAEESVPGPRRR